MVEAGLFFFIALFFLGVVRGYRAFSLVVGLLCFSLILLDFIYHTTMPLTISL